LSTTRFTVQARLSHFSPHFRKTQRCVRWCLAGLFVARPQGLGRERERERDSLGGAQQQSVAAPFSNVLYRKIFYAPGKAYYTPVEFGSRSSFNVVLQSIIYEWHIHTQCIPRGGRQQSVLYASVKLVPPATLARSDGARRPTQHTRNVHALCIHTPVPAAAGN
jgi:hypothetical protein